MTTGDRLPPLPLYPGRSVLVQVDVLWSESGCFGDEDGNGECDAKMAPGDLVYMVYRAEQPGGYVKTSGPTLMRCEHHAMAILEKHQAETRAWLKEHGR